MEIVEIVVGCVVLCVLIGTCVVLFRELKREEKRQKEMHLWKREALRELTIYLHRKNTRGE